VKTLCDRYGVTRAGYYAWCRRAPSARSRRDDKLLERVRAIFDASAGTYGSPRIHFSLHAAGFKVGRKRSDGVKSHFCSLLSKRRPRMALRSRARGYPASSSTGQLGVPGAHPGDAVTDHLSGRGVRRRERVLFAGTFDAAGPFAILAALWPLAASA
jgi:hypothetical protein